MRIRDAHSHFFSLRLFELLAGQAAQSGGGRAEDLLERVTASGVELPGPSPRLHARRWVEQLDLHGVAHAVTFASHPAEAEAVAEGCAEAGGRLTPFVLVDPSSEAGLAAGRRALGDLGFRGILLFPALHRFDPSSPQLDPLYEDASARGAPIVVHCGLLQIRLRDLLGIRPKYDLRAATPLAVSAAAERHPRARFIIPHFGCGYFREALLAGAQSPNVYLDTSSSNSWTSTQPDGLDLAAVFRRALEVFGPKRLLFGTDSSTFPRGWRADILRDQRSILSTLAITASDQERILGGNVAEILELD
ncbi:MAG TPA: amidohydrolase family protein [Planctomycetota bacterium]|nr:amidohydrolase family protein [Planctomycetota bacterium]